MSDTGFVGFEQAARRLGVTIGSLRRAIRQGRIAPPPVVSATARLPGAWVDQLRATIAEKPEVLRGTRRQKVAAFARYEGTSAWRSYPHRVRAYARFAAD
jgi:hypothetical protein